MALLRSLLLLLYCFTTLRLCQAQRLVARPVSSTEQPVDTDTGTDQLTDTDLLTGTDQLADTDDTPKLLVILIDGLRWNAINTSHPTTDRCVKAGEVCVDPDSFFTRAQREGATAAWNTPVFPSTFLPNIYTMATGLLPVEHGMLGEAAEEWNLTVGVTPIWDTAAAAGVRTALLRWLSCDRVTAGPLLSCVDAVTLEGTDNLLVQLLGDAALAAQTLTNEGYSLVMMRTSLMRWASEQHGPDSTATRSVLSQLELVLDDLFSELQHAGLWDQLSVVLLSDSGLSSTAATTALPLLPCLATLPQQPTLRYSSSGSAILAPSPGTTAQQVEQLLQTCSLLPAGGLTYHKLLDLPEADKWPGAEEELLLVAAAGFSLQFHDDLSADAADPLHSADGRLQLGAAATFTRGRAMAGGGYDAWDHNTNGVFIAKGPGIVHGVTGGSLLQTDVYQLLCHMAELPEVERHHGQPEAVAWMHQPSTATSLLLDNATVGVVVAVTLAVMGSLAS